MPCYYDHINYITFRSLWYSWFTKAIRTMTKTAELIRITLSKHDSEITTKKKSCTKACWLTDQTPNQTEQTRKAETKNHSTNHLEMQDGGYLSTDEATKGDGGVLACVNPILVDMSNVDLNGGVILGSDEPVRRRTLPGDVKIHHLALLVLHLRFSPISQATIPARKKKPPFRD